MQREYIAVIVDSDKGTGNWKKILEHLNWKRDRKMLEKIFMEWKKFKIKPIKIYYDEKKWKEYN